MKESKVPQKIFILLKKIRPDSDFIQTEVADWLKEEFKDIENINMN